MDFKLSSEQELLRDEARKLAREVFQEKAARWDRQCEVPWESIRLPAGKGYFGLLIPEQYGGAGSAPMDLLIVLEEIAWACVSTALYVFSANAHANRIAQLGADAHRRSDLPRIASGEVIPCHAMSEPQAGSDASRLRTTAVRDGDHYVVNGTKCWISRGAIAHLYLVDVNFRDGDHAEKGLLLIERGTPGLEIGKVEPLMGHHGSPSTELVFRDCRVPVANRMAKGDFQASLMSMSVSRCCNAAMALGAAQRAFDEAVEYVQQREAFGKRLADFQGLRWMVADMKVKLDAARLLVYRAAANATSGFPSETEAAIAKTFANEAALQVVSDAMQLFGANGYSCAYPLERLYRDVRGLAIAGGTTQIQRNLIARAVLGRRRY
ncbi:MAG: acyl-CoA dehydrogenase family protein [Betaproteobacteria bacterium]|nr:acyl-CoA dehydrogenase family protein [Betaproteobacteria bacterium]